MALVPSCGNLRVSGRIEEVTHLNLACLKAEHSERADQGYAAEVTRLMLAFCFTILNLFEYAILVGEWAERQDVNAVDFSTPSRQDIEEQ